MDSLEVVEPDIVLDKYIDFTFVGNRHIAGHTKIFEIVYAITERNKYSRNINIIKK